MTPDQAISAAFRAASQELARTFVKAESYEGFLISSADHLDQAAQLLTKIAQERGVAQDQHALTKLEHQGLREILQATVSTLLALGHYPYLKRVEIRGEILQ